MTTIIFVTGTNTDVGKPLQQQAQLQQPTTRLRTYE